MIFLSINDRAQAAIEAGTPADLAERAFLAVSLGWLLSNLIPSLSLQPLNLLLAISESLPVFFILIRRFGRMSARPDAWLISMIGTFVPLFVLPVGGAIASEAVCGVIMAAGLLISIAAKLALNRRFGVVPANRGAARSGPYYFVRHPMYLGYMLTHAGFLLANPGMFNLLLYLVTWGGFLWRIRLEEGVLSEDVAYRDYCRAVPYRLIPGLY